MPRLIICRLALWTLGLIAAACANETTAPSRTTLSVTNPAPSGPPTTSPTPEPTPAPPPMPSPAPAPTPDPPSTPTPPATPPQPPATPAPAPSPTPGTFVLRGTVTDAVGRAPIGGATVAVASGTGSGRQATTESHGVFELSGVYGEVQLSISAPGYEPRTVSATMTQDVWIFCELVKVEPVRLEMTGPKSVPLGSEAQYRAFLYYNNGTVEDVTTRANWSAFISAMWPSALGPVTGGMFRAYEEGPGSPHVEYRGFEAGMFVSVTPVGTFLIGGVVTAADVEPPGNYLPGAAILATSSAGPGKVIWHSEWDRGFFIVGVAGAVRLEVSHPGYVTRIINLTVTDLTYIGIELQRQ